MNPFLLARTALGSALVAACAACTPFHFDDQDVSIQHDADQDRLELWITYHDVRAASESDRDRESAEASLKRILAGERHLVIFDLPIDLDEEIDEDEMRNEMGDLADDMLLVIEGISVLDSGATLGDRPPAVWQKIEIKRATRAMALLNHVYSQIVLADFEIGDGETEPWEATTRRLWIEKAQSEGEWLVLDERGLTIQFPMTPAALAGALRDLSREAPAEDEPPLAADLLGALTEVDYVDGELRMTFGFNEEGAIAWNLSRPDLGISTPLDDWLVDSEWFRAALGD